MPQAEHTSGSEPAASFTTRQRVRATRIATWALLAVGLPLFLIASRLSRLIVRVPDDGCPRCLYARQDSADRCPECGYRFPQKSIERTA